MTTRQRIHAVTEDQSVTALELFFDLVFVYALTQVTALISSHLTGRGVAYSQGTLDFRVVTTPPAGGARGRWAGSASELMPTWIAPLAKRST